MKYLFLILTPLLFFDCAYSQEKQQLPDSSILFKVSEGKKFIENCFESHPLNLVDSFWAPNYNERNNLDSNFFKLNKQVSNIHYYAIQYIGLYVNKEKYIYIHAFPNSCLDIANNAGIDLTENVIKIGGKSNTNWTVLFNTSNNEFEKFEFNSE